MMYKGTGLAPGCMSFFPIWLPPVIQGKIGRITTRLPVSIDHFVAELTKTKPGISCEVQHSDILSRFVLILALNRCLPSQWEFA